jgi:type IV secretory pathway VirB4 component
LDFVAPGIVLNDDQSLQATIAVVGPSLRRQSPEVQGAAMLQLNNTLRQLSAGWSLHSETQRFPMAVSAVPEHWGHWVARAVAVEQQQG